MTVNMTDVVQSSFSFDQVTFRFTTSPNQQQLAVLTGVDASGKANYTNVFSLSTDEADFPDRFGAHMGSWYNSVSIEDIQTALSDPSALFSFTAMTPSGSIIEYDDFTQSSSPNFTAVTLGSNLPPWMAEAGNEQSQIIASLSLASSNGLLFKVQEGLLPPLESTSSWSLAYVH